MLLILIPTIWLAISVLVVCLCRMAAMADAQLERRVPGGGQRARVYVLEPTSLAARLRARSARARLKPSGLATIHPIR
jgi:hypothetical protein